MQTLWQELRYGAQMLLKKPGVSLFAAMMLALSIGIGSNTTISGAVRGLFASSTPQDAASKREAPGQEWIEREFASSGAPSLTMAVAQDGRFLWERSWGWADKEKRIPATPQTMYSLASISKPITATGLMTLVERGQIDLDKPINDYLGAANLRAYVGDAHQATVRRVASHTAGLPPHHHFFFADEDHRPPPFAETIRRYGILVRPPGERFEYSNLGFGLIDHAITQVSKQDYATFMRLEVFEPLGLSRMAVGIPPGREQEQAIRYAMTGAPLPFYDFDHRGASAIYASAHDLVRFAFLQIGTLEVGQRRVLSDASLAAMTQPTKGSPFGIGWQLDDRSESRVVFATGHMSGVGAIVFTIPAKRFVVVGLCNAGMDLPVRVAMEVVRRTFPDMRFAPPFGQPPQSSEPIPDKLVGDWIGAVFAHDGKRRFHLWVQAKGEVYAQLADQPRVRISNAEWSDGQLSGSFSGDICADDVRDPHRLHFALTPRSEQLDGPLTAYTSRPGRAGDALSSFLSLRREK
ncbi:MAG TPA: serine hydrolase [Blastocatellia bacterium]|jgi:CubicO group peptidase (beta-lactamase class C family)|nr:serine hydrolase [Blastocatellia bacterium]